MVGGDGVDGAVLQPGDDALDVLGGAQGRVHPGHRALGEHLVLGEGEVLGAGLTGEGDPPLLHPAHDIHRLGGGYVTDVHMGPGLLGQHGVPHDHDLLGDGGAALHPQLAGDAALVHRPVGHHGGVLAVAQDGELQPLGVDEGVPHQIGVVHIAPVVRQGDGPRLFQGVGVGELAPLQAHGHRPDGVHMDAAGLGGLLPDILDLLRGVHCGLGVCHAGHGGDAPPGSGGGSGKNILFVGQPRVPEMDMHIHQAGTHHHSGGVNDLIGLRPDVPLQLEHPAVFHIQVQNGDGAAHRVHHPAVLNQKTHGFVPPSSSPRLERKIKVVKCVKNAQRALR